MFVTHLAPLLLRRKCAYKLQKTALVEISVGHSKKAPNSNYGCPVAVTPERFATVLRTVNVREKGNAALDVRVYVGDPLALRGCCRPGHDERLSLMSSGTHNVQYICMRSRCIPSERIPNTLASSRSKTSLHAHDAVQRRSHEVFLMAIKPPALRS
jgi:hypothetical protein